MFVAKWAIHYVITTSPGGIGSPDQYAVLRKGADGEWEATEPSDVELQEHNENVDALEEHLRNYAARFKPG